MASLVPGSIQIFAWAVGAAVTTHARGLMILLRGSLHEKSFAAGEGDSHACGASGAEGHEAVGGRAGTTPRACCAC